MFQFIVITLVVISAAFGIRPPSYIKTCKLNSPDFNKCALESGQNALPYIVKGDKVYKIPVISPLKLPLIEIKDNNFAITLKNVEVFGIETFTLTDIKLNKTYVDLALHGERLMILGDYEIDSKILILAIKGEGPANITGEHADFHFTSHLSTYEKKGETYFKLDKPDLEFVAKKAYFRLDNLFNGDAALGENVNNFLNENWEEVIKELGKPISQTVVTVVTSIVDSILKYIPERTLFNE